MRVLALALTVLLLSGCGAGEQDARAVTAKEADRLAAARFLNYQDGGRKVEIVVPDSSARMTVTASIDFSEHIGYGVIRTKGSKAPGSQGLLQWTPKVLALRASRVAPTVQPATPPPTGWQGRALQQQGASLDTALLLAFSLANDRPENAQLLKQNGARWLRSEQVVGKRTDVFAGPRTGGQASRLRYWLDSRGRMVKVSARLRTSEEPVTYTFGRGKYIPVKPVRGLAP